jgi:hypothetical protein
MQRNQYRLPARATGVGSQYSVADSVRAGTVSSLDSHGMHGSGDRMTDADRMTAASSRGGRGTGYSRAGDRMTCMTDDDAADMAPDMYPMHPRQGESVRLMQYRSCRCVRRLLCPTCACLGAVSSWQSFIEQVWQRASSATTGRSSSASGLGAELQLLQDRGRWRTSLR